MRLFSIYSPTDRVWLVEHFLMSSSPDHPVSPFSPIFCDYLLLCLHATSGHCSSCNRLRGLDDDNELHDESRTSHEHHLHRDHQHRHQHLRISHVRARRLPWLGGRRSGWIRGQLHDSYHLTFYADAAPMLQLLISSTIISIVKSPACPIKWSFKFKQTPLHEFPETELL